MLGPIGRYFRERREARLAEIDARLDQVTTKVLADDGKVGTVSEGLELAQAIHALRNEFPNQMQVSSLFQEDPAAFATGRLGTHLPRYDQFEPTSRVALRSGLGDGDPWKVRELFRGHPVTVEKTQAILDRLKEIASESAKLGPEHAELRVDPWLIGRTLHLLGNGYHEVKERWYDKDPDPQSGSRWQAAYEPGALPLVLQASADWVAATGRPLPSSPYHPTKPVRAYGQRYTSPAWG